MDNKKVIKIAKQLFDEICKNYQHHDKDISLGIKGEKLHAYDILQWVEKLKPNPPLSLQLAALFHDIDRIVTPKVGGGFKGDRKSHSYIEHKKLHAKRSADFIIPLLKVKGVNGDDLKKIKFLIIHHDDPGEDVIKINDQDLNYLVTADIFSFFTANALSFYKTEGEKRLRDKMHFMINKAPNQIKIQLWEYQFGNKKFNDIKNDIIKAYWIEHNPREKEYRFCPTCKTTLKRKLIDRRSLLTCPKCNFIFWNNPRPVTSAIIGCEGKILMVQRNLKPLKNYWCLPGGCVDYAETPEAACVREIKEETNLDIKIDKLIDVYQIDNDPRGINLDIIYSAFSIKGKLKINQESQQYRYFELNELPKLIAYKHQQAITDWKNGLVSPTS